MLKILLTITIKDWLIVLASIILIICILKIRKLKKTIAQEIHSRLLPQLSLELISDVDREKTGFYLENESFFLARDIEVEELKLDVEEYSFKKNIILKFESVDLLKPKERIKLKFRVFDRIQELFTEEPEKIIAHLISTFFKVKINYSNIEAIKFGVVFAKKRDKFYTEDFKACQY